MSSHGNSNKSEYLLLFRGTDWTNGLSPEEMQQAAQRFMAWFERLKNEGTVKGGQPLESAGRVVSGKGGRTVADGPFAESKEAIGGYFLLNVNSLDEAVQVAKGCPGLDLGMKVEVRPVAEQCPTLRDTREILETATA